MDKRNSASDNTQFTESDRGHLVEIVKMRTEALVSYSNRIWAVFNLFQTLILAILAVILTKDIADPNHTFYLALISILFSFLWFLIGVNDFLSMEKHKTIKKSLEEKLIEILNLKKEFSEDKNPIQKILSRFHFNQTRALFIVPIINITLLLILIIELKFPFL